MGHAKSVWDLEVYRTARAVSKGVFDLSQTFPKEEMYALTDQVRRSARSVGAQISEAWAKRRYPRHFISKLTDAAAEQFETEHWLSTAAGECGYITQQQADELIAKSQQVGRMLYAMIEKAEQFCSTDKTLIREPDAVYLVEDEDEEDGDR
ncbi:MAG: four helix bundle protein [Armatimonadota bacterium]